MPFSNVLRRTPVPSTNSTRRLSDSQSGVVGHHTNPLQPIPVQLPAITALNVSCSSFVVGVGAGRKPCAYVVIDVTAGRQNALQRGSPADLLDNEAGLLHGLQMAINIQGPASLAWEVGAPQCQTLREKDRWAVVVKLGMKENLAAKVSSSVRSRHGKATSLALIDQFLHTLESDTKRSEPVFAHVAIKYRHTLLPEDTTLETRAVCCVGSLTTTSPISALTDTALSTSLVHALDSGSLDQRINSVERLERRHFLTFPADEAMTLIEDFRHVFAEVIPRAVDTDLGNLEAYYFYARNNKPEVIMKSTFKESLRRARARVSKLSLRKKKSMN